MRIIKKKKYFFMGELRKFGNPSQIFDLVKYFWLLECFHDFPSIF